MRKHTFIFLFLLLCLAGCTNRLSEKKTLDILLEFYLYDNLAKETADSVSLPLSVFEKYGVSQSDFEATMQYYVEHPKKMKALYETLKVKMQEKIAQYEQEIEEDEINRNLWTGADTLAVDEVRLPEKLAFHLPVDKRGTFQLKAEVALWADDSTTKPRMTGYFLRRTDSGTDTIAARSASFTQADAPKPYTLSYSTADTNVYAFAGYWLCTDDTTERRQHIRLQKMRILFEEAPGLSPIPEDNLRIEDRHEFFSGRRMSPVNTRPQPGQPVLQRQSRVDTAAFVKAPVRQAE